VRLLVAGLLVLAAAGGCGEDTIRLADYVERANAICRDNNTRGRAELERVRNRLEADGELDSEELPELNRKALEILRPGLDRLAELSPPDQQQDVAETYERASREANDAFADVIKAQEDGDIERFRDAKARNAKHTQQAREAAAELGLDDCAPG
jgi:thioesterase domain-containing protein